MEKLSDLKKELAELSKPELIQLCLRVAKLKRENKELLAYLIFDADDPLFYAQKLKPEIREVFEQPFQHAYYLTKSIRKTMRLITKYYRFTSNKQGETELLIYLAEQFHNTWRKEYLYQALGKVIFRCLEKAEANLKKIDEDFRADFEQPIEELINKTETRFGVS
jgi:hypothetical protein